MRATTAILLTTVWFPVSGARADETSEQAAADLLGRRLQNEAPREAALLRGIQGKEIVVVRGSMDQIENVLRVAKIKHTVISPAEVGRYQFRGNQVVMVNCPGTMPRAGVDAIARFVKAGGTLYTTDWALENLVQKAFPGTIKFNGRPTGSEVVPVTIDDPKDPITASLLMRKGSKPQWWLEGSSHPIKIIDANRVQVLAHAPAMGKRYGASPVVVRFKWEDGEVIHVVSHFVRQMATSGPNVAAKAAVQDYDGLTAQDKAAFAASAAAGAVTGDVESSYAFQRMTSNLVVEKQKSNVEWEKKYGMSVRGPMGLAAAPNAAPDAAAPTVTKESRLRVLRRQGEMAEVRDDRGREGWVRQDELVAR